MSNPMQARRLMIYLGESDLWRGRSLYMSILETLRKSGIAGATVTRAIAGYGAHSRIRTHTIEVLSVDLPIVITIVDTPDNIDKALALVSPMVREGLITVEDVTIVKYTHRHLQPLPADVPVSEIMTRNITTVTAETTARQVVALLLGKLFKAVPVVDDEQRVVGIITESDLLRNAGMPARLAIGERLEAADLQAFLAPVSSDKTAADIMTRPVITTQSDEVLGYAVQRMMQHNLKRMPVVDDDGKLIGMVSRLDILRAVAGQRPAAQEQAPQVLPGGTIGELMTTPLPAVHVNDDLADVLQSLLQSAVKGVIVLDEREHPVGIITDGDIVARVSPVMRRNVLGAISARVLGTDVKRGEATAGELMSERVVTAPPQMTVVEAISLLLHEGRKRLIVVNDEGQAVGLIDRQTLLAASISL